MALTPIRAIRAKCLDCSGDMRNEVKNCVIKTCPLYPYRMGKRPPKAESPEQNDDEKDE